MKFVIQKFITVVLAIAVLVSATGITVFQMACSKSKKVYVSLEDFKTCCPSKKAECGFKKKCCNFSLKSLKPTQLSNPQFKTVDFAVLSSFVSPVLVSLTQQVKPTGKINCYHKAPPLAGRLLLNTISKFSI